MGDMRNMYRILVRKSEMKRPLKRPNHRWENNIILDIKEMGWAVVDLSHLTQDRDQ
jgi:hypothetical protein